MDKRWYHQAVAPGLYSNHGCLSQSIALRQSAVHQKSQQEMNIIIAILQGTQKGSFLVVCGAKCSGFFSNYLLSDIDEILTLIGENKHRLQ